MHFPVFWDEVYAIKKKMKTGMHGCVQLDACDWWDRGRVGVICGSKTLEGDTKEHAIMKNSNLGVREGDWLFNVTCKDTLVTYVTAHRCEEEVGPTVGLPTP